MKKITLILLILFVVIVGFIYLNGLMSARN